MDAFVIIFMLVVIWTCLRSLGRSHRYRDQHRERRLDRHLADIERRAALPPQERKRETKRDRLVYLLIAMSVVAMFIGIFGQSAPYFCMGTR